MKDLEKLDIIIITIAIINLILTIYILYHLTAVYADMCGAYATYNRYLNMLEQLRP